MSTIFGLAQLSAADYQFMRQADNRLIYDAVNVYLQQAMMDMRDSASLFIEGTTTKAKEQYQLPMGGRMQERSGQTKSDSVRRSGKWDVAYPIKEFGDTVATTDVDMAYMTPAEFQTHIDGVLIRAANTYRFEILRRVFKNTTDSFTDARLGSLTIQPLANGTAGELYPPEHGSESEATQDHYLESNYDASAISDTNNPIKTMTDKLILRYGRRTGGIPIVTLINSAQRAKIEALTNFRPYVPTPINPGADTDIVIADPAGVGETIGYINSSWVSVWDWIPSNYLVSVYQEAPKPLFERIDLPETGLGQGLQLVSRSADYPLLYNEWRWRFGVGTGNRLNGVVMELGTGGTYSIPSDYA
jgi:hypothetical protein